MKYLGNNIEIVVQKTSDDGMVVGVAWKLGSSLPQTTLLYILISTEFCLWKFKKM